MATRKRAKSRRKSKLAAYLRRKAAQQRKRMWANHKKNASARKKVRRERRSDVRETRQSHLEAGATRTESFLTRHGMISGLLDLLTLRLHQFFDMRDLHGGVVTTAEFDQLEKFSTQEEWRQAIFDERTRKYRKQRAERTGAFRGPIVMAYVGTSDTGRVVEREFRVPTPRVAIVRTQLPVFSPPPERRKRNRRGHRDVVNAWRPQIVKIGQEAMAADSDLRGAGLAVQAFAEQFPTTRTQVHQHAAAFAEFGASFSTAMETFMSTLRQGMGEDNPGMPPEVVDKLSPLTDVGETMRNAATAFSAAWEDYFRAAIEAARDEHTPNKQALVS